MINGFSLVLIVVFSLTVYNSHLITSMQIKYVLAPLLSSRLTKVHGKYSDELFSMFLKLYKTIALSSGVVVFALFFGHYSTVMPESMVVAREANQGYIFAANMSAIVGIMPLVYTRLIILSAEGITKRQLLILNTLRTVLRSNYPGDLVNRVQVSLLFIALYFVQVSILYAFVVIPFKYIFLT